MTTTATTSSTTQSNTSSHTPLNTTIFDNTDHTLYNENTQQKKRPLQGVLVSQFFGAFNDNAWKIIVFTLATRALVPGSEEFETTSQYQATLGFLFFLLPMLLFALPAGALADRISKRSIIIATKALEVALMAAAVITLFIAPQSLVIPYIILGLLGVQSALFSPAKYGILPELLPKEKLSKGNGLIEMFTMLAIIGGTGLGPVFLAADSEGALPALTWTAALWLLILSSIGFLYSLTVPPVPAAINPASNSKPLDSIRKALKSIRHDKTLYLAVLGTAFYWFIISLLGQNVLVYAKSLVVNLQRGELLQGIPPASYGLGIAFGAWFSGKHSGDRIEYGLIPLGSIAFAITSILLGLIQPGMPGTVVILILMGMASGTVIVPLHALLQWRAPKDRRGGVIAFGNMLDIIGMTTGSLIAAGMAWLGFSLQTMLITSALLVVLATAWAIRVLPAALIRLIFILLTITFYRIKVLGGENIPKKGPALLVSNHMSIIDALFVMATVDRPVRFLMKDTHYNKWWVKPLAKIMNAIPISSTAGSKQTLAAMREASQHLEQGHLVCIFPEGKVSLNGVLLPFRRGIEVMMRDRRCPIIPIHLDLVWGSIFSYDKGRFLTKIPNQIPYPLTISFGDPLPANTEVDIIRKAIQKLGTEAWNVRKQRMELNHRLFIREARWKPWKTAIADARVGKLNRFEALTGAIALSRKLSAYWKGEGNIAILLPTNIPAILTNVAVSLSCRTAINLNFTAGTANIKSAIDQAQIKTIITSREFLQKNPVELPTEVHVIYLEDIKKQFSKNDKIIASLFALFAPFRAVEKYCRAEKRLTIDDIQTIIFTSGSTGSPKGVVLTGYNVISNIEAVSQVIPPMAKRDKILMALPLFHGFGYMQMWLGLNHDLDLILHPNPLEAQAIGKLVDEYKPSIMMTTPTFLKVYLQKVLPEQFSSFHCVLTGAEKLPQKLADEFEDKFGIRPIEGYGTTECSPVVATCVPNIRTERLFQSGTSRGTVGHPLPGVMIKIVDPETFEELNTGTPGLLLVKGPNVMQGYLNRSDLTKDVMHEGWYITGDIAAVDEDGHIRITDRLSRFSKIGGEMVPHGTIEEALHRAVDTEERLFAVTSIPDASKGERLVVLHTFNQESISDLIAKISEFGLPNLFIPRSDCFLKVEKLPMLGTGKLDLATIKELAVQMLGSKE